MSKYSKFDVDKVKRDADIRRIIPGASESKAKQYITCPFCGKEKKFGITHDRKNNCARCFSTSCGEGFTGPLEAYAYYNGLDIKNDFVKVLEGTAQQCGILITPEETRRKETVQKTRESIRKTFAAQQLEGSGLSVEDLMANVIEDGQEITRCRFQPGSMGQGFMPDLSHGDDMLIFYYDLYGRPVTYTAKGSKTPRKYVRVRYANPDIHQIDGKSVKYQTAAGASTQVYIPEAVRRLFKAKAPVDVLFLQEGEKKAEKACKHGMVSLGLQGIGNIGSAENGLIQAIQDVVKTCHVRHVVLVMDSDWNDLSGNITTGDRADKRPNSFSKAVIKFKQYMETFHNLGLSVDVWWGHVNENEHGDKGVDDLLVGSLKGCESELMEDIEHTMHTHDGRGKWLDVHKITALSDAKIRDFWMLNDRQAFFEAHRDRLTEIPTFKIGNIRYKVENGNLVPVSRYSSAVVPLIRTNCLGYRGLMFNFYYILRLVRVGLAV